MLTALDTARWLIRPLKCYIFTLRIARPVQKRPALAPIQNSTKELSLIALQSLPGLRTLSLLGVVLTPLLLSGPAQARSPQDTADEPQISDSFSLLGSYLAGVLARKDSDLKVAAEYYNRALMRDPDNKQMLEEAFMMEVSAGDLDKATSLARRLVQASEAGNGYAYLLLGVDALNRGAYEQARVFFSTADSEPVFQLADNFALVWTEVGAGQFDDALDALSAPHAADGSRYFQRMHTALVADLAGRRELARENYAAAYQTHTSNRRLVEAYARHAAVHGDDKLLQEVLEPFLSADDPDAVLNGLAERLKADPSPGFLVTTPQQGLAEVLFGLAGVLASESEPAARIFLRFALLLDPAFDSAHYLLGELETQAKRYEASLEAYEGVQPASPYYLDARIRAAFLLNALERSDEGVGLLTAMMGQHPDEPRLLQAIGNILRDQKSYEPAARFYSQAIEMIGEPSSEHWLYFYARGICYERIKQWEKAELDFKKALELNPGQASVMNYLGYSWVDQNMHLEKAMDLIRDAVDREPNNGYYVDSLGWAHYKLGEYDAAVEQLEKAVELRPEDPVLNDHLGDAYWQVGRKREARFQWSYALTLEPEPEEEQKIRDKLANGLQESNRKAELKEAAGSADMR
jgi:tetratricopeptide (TPR) repeat protein